MGLPYPHFLINFKIYEGTAGEDGRALVETVQTVQEQTGATFAISPQTPDLTWLARETSVPIVAQSATAAEPGRGNGDVSLAGVAAGGVDGVVLNHPESRVDISTLQDLVDGCRTHGLESIVCVDSIEMGRAVMAFEPDCLLFEEPGDIATDRSMTETHPKRVEAFVDAVESERPETRVLLGGGISTAADVERALALGADAVGAASAFVDADDKHALLTEIAQVLVEGG